MPLTVLQLALALILTLSAGGKALRWRHATSGTRTLLPGLHPKGAVALTALVIGVETSAAILLAGVAPKAGGIVTELLGFVFAGLLIARHLSGSRRLACGCFGGSIERSTAWLIARALLLALAGMIVALQMGAGVEIGRETFQLAAILVLAAIVLVLGALLAALYRQVGALLLRLPASSALELEHEGPPLGKPAPAQEELWHTGIEVVAFTVKGCRLCGEILPGVRALARSGRRVVTIDEDTSPLEFAAWRVPGAPYLVVVLDGLVAAKGLVNTLEQAEGLVDAAIARREHIGT